MYVHLSIYVHWAVCMYIYIHMLHTYILRQFSVSSCISFRHSLCCLFSGHLFVHFPMNSLDHHKAPQTGCHCLNSPWPWPWPWSRRIIEKLISCQSWPGLKHMHAHTWKFTATAMVSDPATRTYLHIKPQNLKSKPRKTLRYPKQQRNPCKVGTK